MDRGSGRTKQMVENLPEGGAVIVVPNQGLKRYIRAMINDLRGSELVGKTDIYVIGRIGDDHQLMGVRKPVFVDHAFTDTATPSLRRLIDTLIEPVNRLYLKSKATS